jgi:peptidyl-dipeptidase A
MRIMKATVSLLALAAACLTAACTTAAADDAEVTTAAAAQPTRPAEPAPAPPANTVTAADADAFIERAERELAELSVISARAQWVNATYITEDTDALAAHFGTIGTQTQVRLANEAARFANVQGLSYDTRRKLDILRTGITLPAPTATPAAAAELNQIATRLQSAYGRGRGTMNGETLTGNEIEARMGTVRNPQHLQEMWTSWNNNVGSPMRQDYARMVQIANEGARELGFSDTGAMWRSVYDMPPEEFAALTDRLWNQVKPLYDELHCFTRAGLNRKYGDQVQPATGPIRADLLGNLWAQEWGNIYDVVAPRTTGQPSYDLTQLLTRRGYTPERIVRQGEAFFSSLGFAPLPATFWQRSMITQPRDREVVCHASAWDVDNVEDLRIKMCTRVNADDFVTVHHELGHNYYQRAYNRQPFLYLNSANDGFHEAVGDTIALSITPEYLQQIGLLNRNQMPTAEQDRDLLLRQALDKIAFLPFGLMVDRWRWGVFSGQTAPTDYQRSWDALRLQYQGIVPPTARTEANFDPGAKYHVPASVPYTRYFLARILQFQFYQAACRQAGWTGPLHRCSFYGNREVGRRLNAMLEMGASKPWPDALEAFTGSREMSGDAMIAYFEPLLTWLREQNRGRRCGW